MEKDLVSIIMPSYNTAAFISESINSVLNQTYRLWELIIVDDCSTDYTAEIVSGFHDDRIRFVRNSKNMGAAYSRNKALRLAEGEWIAFLDSDDLWCETKIEEQLLFMKKNNLSFTYTKYQELDENGEPLGRIVSGPKKITKFLMYVYCWPGCLTVMYNANVVGLIQIANLKKNNDYALWLEISSKEKCYLLDRDLAGYRKRKGSISNTSYIKLVKHHYLLFRVGRKMSKLKSSIWCTINMFGGILKKIIYVEKLCK